MQIASFRLIATARPVSEIEMAAGAVGEVMELRARIKEFYGSYFSIGDRLGESFYAVWMGVASIGLLNATATITRADVVNVVLVAFVVNLTWGLIDGITAMYTSIIERAERDRLLYDLRTGKSDPRARDAALSSLGETIVGSLDLPGRQKVVDALAAGRPGENPRNRKYRAGNEDWSYALGTLCIDVFLVVPLVAPIILIPDVKLGVYISRLVATLIFASLGAAYARNLNRNHWLAAAVLGALGAGLFTLTYAAGW